MSRKPTVTAKPRAARKMPASADTGAVHVPAAGEGKRGEQGYLGYLLRQAHAAVRLTMERTLADLGVTSPQFAVLTMLKAYPGLSGADLARLTFLTPQTVGVIIRNLDRDGAIVMTPHPVHGRIQQWPLTPRGATLLKACRQRVLELEKRLARDLGARTEVAIRRWLAGIAADLQED